MYVSYQYIPYKYILYIHTYTCQSHPQLLRICSTPFTQHSAIPNSAVERKGGHAKGHARPRTQHDTPHSQCTICRDIGLCYFGSRLRLVWEVGDQWKVQTLRSGSLENQLSWVKNEGFSDASKGRCDSRDFHDRLCCEC